MWCCLLQAQPCMAGDSAGYERRASAEDDVVVVTSLRTPICKVRTSKVSPCHSLALQGLAAPRQHDVLILGLGLACFVDWRARCLADCVRVHLVLAEQLALAATDQGASLGQEPLLGSSVNPLPSCCCSSVTSGTRLSPGREVLLAQVSSEPPACCRRSVAG